METDKYKDKYFLALKRIDELESAMDIDERNMIVKLDTYKRECETLYRSIRRLRNQNV